MKSSFTQRRSGFSLVEVTVACAMTAFLAVMLSATWQLLMPTTSKVIAWGQLFQEMDIAVASLSRDVGGCLPDSDCAGDKKAGRLLGVRQRGTENVLELWFDGGSNPDTPPTTWGPITGDTVIAYSVPADTDITGTIKEYLLTRTRTVTGSLDPPTSFVVANLGKPPTATPTAAPLPALAIKADSTIALNEVSGLQIELTFTYHFPREKYTPNYDRNKDRYAPLSRKCTLWIAKVPQ